jgi:hypothetical protein
MVGLRYSFDQNYGVAEWRYELSTLRSASDIPISARLERPASLTQDLRSHP